MENGRLWESTETETPGGMQGSADDTLRVPIIEIADLLSRKLIALSYDKCDCDCANPNYQLGVYAWRKARLSPALSPNWSLVIAASKAGSEHFLVSDRSKHRA